MKRLLSLTLVLLLALATVPAFAGGTNMYVVKCKNWVSMREYPDTKSAQLAKVPIDATVTNCTVVDSKWVYGEYNGHYGYILKSYLSTLPEPFSTLPDQEVCNCKTSVSLRKSMSTSAAYYTQVPKGQKVINCEKHGAWVKCTYGAYTGYILAEYLKEYKGGSVTPVAIEDQKVVNVNEWVSLKASMSTSAERLYKVPKGAVVEKCWKIGSWVECDYDTKTSKGVIHGYIKASYLTKANGGTLKITDTMVVANVTSYVNLRSSASSKSTSLGTVKKGFPVTNCVDGGNGFVYCYDEASGRWGYILGKYLKTTANLGTGVSVPDQKVYNVNSYVNMRAAASTSAYSKKEIKKDWVVTDCTDYGTWTYCQYKGTWGFILSKYLKNA